MSTPNRSNSQGARVRRYRNLGVFSDLVEMGIRQRGVFSDLPPHELSPSRIHDALGTFELSVSDVRTERRWTFDGVSGEELSWSVGFGPRTHAFVLKPDPAPSRLPGVLALHCHGGQKWYGKEKIADGPDAPAHAVVRLRDELYDGRAIAHDIAKAGAVVLCPDVFCWGSRRFPLEEMPERAVRYADDQRILAGLRGERFSDVCHYDAAAWIHEHTVAKYCGLLGTSFAGVVASEDLAAFRYLRQRPDVLPEHTATIGLSGGGCRAALLGALDEHPHATVVVAMMSSYPELLDGYVDRHTWMLLPPGLSRVCDWPDLTAVHAPSPLLVLFAERDSLFPPSGMRAADARLARAYAERGCRQNYTSHFLPTTHRFDTSMQSIALRWLLRQFGSDIPQ